jgi:DNA-binding transcriptional MocR family regulator
MALKYANRMNNIKASEIRELLKLTQRPEIISFAGGLPAPESFPIQEFIKVGKEVLEKSGAQALQYASTEGHPPLREAITKRMAKVKVEVNSDDILVTSGSQQGLDFAAKIFINPGDIIICESPTYLGAINAFKAYEPKFIEVSTDKDGMNMDELEKALKNNNNVKFIYVIPDFQNPSGKTWSIERRVKLIELGNKYDVAIIEDNPYGELRFEGEILPAVKHFDTEGRVAFLGTFSKILCPGLRLGWIAASPEMLNKFIMVKQGADLQSSTISQMEAAKFFELYDIEAHIQKIIDLYRVRRDLMMKTIEEEFPEGVTATYPEGGLFTWVILPEYMNARELALKALEQNVAYVPGGSFFPNGGNENTFRLNYSNMDEERIVEGIKRLGKVLKDAIR